MKLAYDSRIASFPLGLEKTPKTYEGLAKNSASSGLSW
jgi:hypothetical protein